MVVSGRWRSPFLKGCCPEAGALLLAPFAFLIRELWLPPDHLYTVDIRQTTPVDVFLQNYAYAASRCENIAFQPDPDPLDEETLEKSRMLIRRYSNILYQLIKEPFFAEVRAPELVLAATHLPLRLFENVLLDSGLRHFRRTSSRSACKNAVDAQASEGRSKPLKGSDSCEKSGV